MLRVIYLVHQSHGRTRLRLGWLREAKSEAPSIADKLSSLPGMEEVEIRPFTGSVLCMHDSHELPHSRIVDELKDFTRGDLVVGIGEERPAEVEREIVGSALASGSEVARAATRAIEELDLEVLRASKGSVNLGTLAALGFIAAGAAEIVATGKLPLPPWFNLGWWAFRTFTISERKVIADVRDSFSEEIAAAEAKAGA